MMYPSAFVVIPQTACLLRFSCWLDFYFFESQLKSFFFLFLIFLSFFFEAYTLIQQGLTMLSKICSRLEAPHASAHVGCE